MSKYSQIAEDSNVSFVPLIFLDTGKAHHVAAKFIKWLFFVAIPGSRCQKNKSVAIGNAWTGRFLFLLQNQNAITIQNSIKITRQKVSRTGANTHHGYSNDYLNSDKIANIYFTSDVDARNRVRDLNEYNKINLNEMRRKNMLDDGVFNFSQNSRRGVDDDVESNDSQANLKDVDDKDDG